MKRILLIAVVVLSINSICFAGQGMGPGPGMTRLITDFTGFENGMNDWVASGNSTFTIGSYAHTGDKSVVANIGSGDTATLTKNFATGSNGSITLYYIAQLCTFSVSVDSCTNGKCATVYAGVDGTWQSLTITGLSASNHTFTIQASGYSGAGGGSTSVFIDDIDIH